MFRIGVKPERFNQPNHGQSRTQPLGTLPYEVIATTDQYQPGQQIQGIKKSNCFSIALTEPFIATIIFYCFVDVFRQLPYGVENFSVDFSYKPEMQRQMNGLDHGKIAKTRKQFPSVHR